jgi:hypothetical protein
MTDDLSGVQVGHEMLDARSTGPGVACKSFALPATFTYIVIHGSYS